MNSLNASVAPAMLSSIPTEIYISLADCNEKKQAILDKGLVSDCNLLISRLSRTEYKGVVKLHPAIKFRFTNNSCIVEVTSNLKRKEVYSLMRTIENILLL